MGHGGRGRTEDSVIGWFTLRASRGFGDGSSTLWKVILSVSSWCISMGVLVPLRVDGLMTWSKGSLVDCESYGTRYK